MEELVGKQRMHRGKIELNKIVYQFELYLDPNEPKNCQVFVLHRPGKDSIITEFNSEKEDVHDVLKRLV